MTISTRHRLSGAILASVPVAFLGYFFFYPLVAILFTARAAAENGQPLLSVLTRPALLGVAWFTIWQAVASTVMTIVVAVPGAYVLARYDFRGRRLIRALTIVPFVLPTVVVGAAFLALMGPGGVLGIDLTRSVAAILIAHVFFNYAVVVRTVGGFWEQLDPRVEEAAMVLGASRWRVFREVTLPLLAPSIASAASIVFLFTFTSFGVVLILGGFGRATIEVEIWRQALGLFDLPAAAVLAMAQLLAVGLTLASYARYQQRRSRQLDIVAARPWILPRGGQRWLLAGNLAIMAVLLGSPIAVLTWRSLRTGDGISADFYRGLGGRLEGTGLFVAPAAAIGNSLRFAVAATVIAVVVGGLAAIVIAYRSGPASRFFDVMLMLPLGTSAVTLGFGFLVALDAPIDLRTSAWLIPIAHALVAIPFVVRTAVPVMRRVRSRLREAATVLGASPARAWREIDLPLIAQAAAVGAGFAFAVSLGEFGATAFIARPDTPTLPIAIFRLLGRPGTASYGRAMALSVILMALTALAVLAIERLRRGRSEGF